MRHSGSRWQADQQVGWQPRAPLLHKTARSTHMRSATSHAADGGGARRAAADLGALEHDDAGRAGLQEGGQAALQAAAGVRAAAGQVPAVRLRCRARRSGARPPGCFHHDGVR